MTDHDQTHTSTWKRQTSNDGSWHQTHEQILQWQTDNDTDCGTKHRNRFYSDRLTMTQGQCLTAVRLTKCPDIRLAGESGVLKNFRGRPLHRKLGASRTLVFIIQNIPGKKIFKKNYKREKQKKKKFDQMQCCFNHKGTFPNFGINQSWAEEKKQWL